MAKNLRLRTGDKLKVIPLGSEEDQPRSGDMVLMKHDSPPKVASVTFSPILDSLNALEAREGGDELSDDEISERFLTPYLNLAESTALVKKNSVLAITDDNGRTLDFMVTYVELEDDAPADKAEADEEEDGKFFPGRIGTHAAMTTRFSRTTFLQMMTLRLLVLPMLPQALF